MASQIIKITRVWPDSSKGSSAPRIIWLGHMSAAVLVADAAY